MSGKTDSAPGYERFQPQDATVAIQFSYEARDRMLSEVMTGFGAVPRRGAEVGGILVGRTDASTIWVDDVVLIPCEHRRGPSFLLSEQDRKNLDGVMSDLETREGGRRPVGMFRSNTRDLDSVSDEDRDVFRSFFPPPDGVFLMIRPFATKPSTATFLLYRGESLPDSSGTFYLRRSQPAGAPLEHRRALGAAVSRGISPERALRLSPDPDWLPASAAPVSSPADPASEMPGFDSVPQFGQLGDGGASGGSRRRQWMLVPLSFIFLLLGVLLGFQSALTFYPKPKDVDSSALTAGLTAARKGENLHIRWNREALAIASAKGGTLEIDDGPNRKTVELDASALQNGSVIYPPVTDHVTLRFDLRVNSGTRLIETLSWSKKPE